MITMKEQADQFRKLLQHMNAPKKTINTGIAVPYENLANSCIEFAPGECYSFFGGQGANILSYWKTNLLWKLLQNGASICVLEGGDSFRRDFVQMACLQAKIDPDMMMSGQGDVVSKKGDIWQLGKHRIICGDSLEKSTFEALLGDKKADMIFTDPPYNVKINGHVCGNGGVQHKEFAMARTERDL